MKKLPHIIAASWVYALLAIALFFACKPTAPPETELNPITWEQLARIVDRIDTPNVNQMVFGTTIVDPEASFTELTALDATWSNLGLISRRGSLWRYLKGDTLKNAINDLISAGTSIDSLDNLLDVSVTANANDFLYYSGSAWTDLPMFAKWNATSTQHRALGSLSMTGSYNVDSVATLYWNDANPSGKKWNTKEDAANGDWHLLNGSSEYLAVSSAGAVKFADAYTFPSAAPTAGDHLVATSTSAVDWGKSYTITLEVYGRTTSLPGTAQYLGTAFFTVPDDMDSLYIQKVHYSFYTAGSGGTYPIGLEKNGATNVFQTTIAAGDKAETMDGPYQIFNGDTFVAEIFTTSAATTEPIGLVVTLYITD